MKRIDSVVTLLLFLMLFLISLAGYLVKIDSTIDQYSDYKDNVAKIKLIDKSFDNFLMKRSIFINYDEINSEIFNFEETFAFLNSEASHQLFDQRYSFLLTEIQLAFEKKLKTIEKYKSNSATLLNDVHYILDLNKAIQNYKSHNEKVKKMVQEQTLLLMSYYINSYAYTDKIEDNLVSLTEDIKEDSDVELTLFVMNVTSTVKHVQNYHTIDKEVLNKEMLGTYIDDLHKYLNDDYKQNISLHNTITIMLFLITFVILFVLLIMYKRSLEVKDELIGFKSAVENSDNSIVMTDADKNITYVNDVFEKETGYTSSEVLGQNPRVLKSGKMPQEMYDELNTKLNNGEKWEGEFINKRKDESLYYEKASIIPIYISGVVKHYLAIKLNITNYIEQKKELEYLALYDTLTKLPNRTHVEKIFKQKMKIAKRTETKMALLFIDLDRFKVINDTLGHTIGDELLIETAKRLQGSLRESDILSRLGGDEFLIVLESLEDEYHVAKVCEKIIKLFSMPIQLKGHTLTITMSIGVSIFPDDGLEYEMLLKHSDTAMYQAKSSGKNTFKFYQKRLSVEIESRLDIEQRFNTALANNEFFVVYQPKYTLIDKKIIAFEALVRWNNDSVGNITPDKFIPIAEETGFILELGLFVFKQACEDFLVFKGCCKDLKGMAINVSAVQFYQKTFINDVVSIIDDLDIAPDEITLEITETYIMKNIEHSMKILSDLKNIGFHISIDDFGTGHSSLNYLKKFPIDELKIDKSFVDGVLDDPNDIAITKIIIGLSQNLDYTNIAEGIENKEQEEFLIESGCYIGQGFYFCRPKTKEDMMDFMLKRLG